MPPQPSTLFEATPPGFRLAELVIRLSRPEERTRWVEPVDHHHDLRFKRFAGRGLRYIFEWWGGWIGLADWQSGAFKYRPRNGWVGWTARIQSQRLHWVANNTRLPLPGQAGAFPGGWVVCAVAHDATAERGLGRGLRPGLLAAETFVDPACVRGSQFRAAGLRGGKAAATLEARRNGPQHHETVTLVAHGSGLPLTALASTTRTARSPPCGPCSTRCPWPGVWSPGIPRAPSEIPPGRWSTRTAPTTC